MKKVLSVLILLTLLIGISNSQEKKDSTYYSNEVAKISHNIDSLKSVINAKQQNMVVSVQDINQTIVEYKSNIYDLENILKELNARKDAIIRLSAGREPVDKPRQ